MENIMELSEIINQKVYNLLDIDFAQKCKKDLDQNGVLTLSNFLNANTLKELPRYLFIDLAFDGDSTITTFIFQKSSTTIYNIISSILLIKNYILQ